MLIGVFKSNQRAINIVVIVFVVLLWLPSFYYHPDININKNSLFLFFESVIDLRWLNSVVSILFIIGQAIYLNHIANEFKLVKNNTHLISLMFIVLNGLSMSILTFSPVLIINWIVLLVIHQVFSIYNLKSAFSLSFNVGLLIGIGVMFYLPIIVLIPLLWFGLIYTKTVLWREFALSIIGLLVPLSYGIGYYFLTDQFISFHFIDWSAPFFKYDYNLWSFYSWIPFIFIGGLAIFGCFFYLLNSNSNTVRIRKHILLTVVVLLLFLTTILINGRDFLSTYMLSTIPLSIIIAYFFNEIKKKWLDEIIFLAFIGVIILGYFS
jgi:hypothetical protein